MSGKLTEPRSQMAFLLERHRIDLLLDVGANVGQYAAAMRKAGYQGGIVSFEPQTAAHASLVKAAADDASWTVAPRCALGDSEGEISINISAESDMSSALAFTPETELYFASDRFIGHETAPAHRLDRLWAGVVPEGARVFLKSDTQGFDLNVLRGAGERLDRIIGIQIETSLHPIYEGQPDYRTVLDFLLPKGFAVMQVIPGYFSRHHGRMLEMDLVLFRPD